MLVTIMEQYGDVYYSPHWVSWYQRRRGLKVGRAGSHNCQTQGGKFPTEEIIGPQNFNFAPKFPQNGSFQPEILHLWTSLIKNDKIFQQAKI